MKLLRKIAVLGILVATLSLTAIPQTGKIDLDALITETQKSGPDKDELTLVWWIPLEFWKATLAEQKLGKAEAEEFIGILRPYILVAVMDGAIPADGKTKFRTESEIVNHIRIVAGKSEYTPLPADKIGPGMREVLKTMKPMVSNMIGSFGTNLHFIVFPSTDSTGVQIVDESRNGSFSVRLQANRLFTWRLPLASMTPPKICPNDGEKLPANWKYCPFHGVELKNQ